MARLLRCTVVALVVATATVPGVARGQASERPANDDFADATVITGTRFSDIVDTRSATNETGEPVTRFYQTGKTVWYRFTATDPGDLFFTTCGWFVFRDQIQLRGDPDEFNTVVQAFVGTDVAHLEPAPPGNGTFVSRSDDWCSELYEPGTRLSTMHVPLVPETTYSIQLGGYRGASGIARVNVLVV